MDTLSYKTLSPNAQSVEHQWVVIDATDQPLGRLCSKVAILLRGKNKPTYSPNVECGDNVIIINADKVRLTGKKMTDRIYLNYTGYPGGQRELNMNSFLLSLYGVSGKKGVRKTSGANFKFWLDRSNCRYDSQGTFVMQLDDLHIDKADIKASLQNLPPPFSDSVPAKRLSSAFPAM